MRNKNSGHGNILFGFDFSGSYGSHYLTTPSVREVVKRYVDVDGIVSHHLV